MSGILQHTMQSKLLPMEGIRGIASFIVLLSHLQLVFFTKIDTEILSYTLEYFPPFVAYITQYIFAALHDGNFSVWLFWVMSGFVLSLGYFKISEIHKSRTYILISSIKRYFRLVIPVLISVIFAYFLLVNNFMTNQSLALKLNNNWLSTFYAFDASLYHAIKSAIYDSFLNFNRLNSYNRVLWTMEAELYGSLFIFSLLGIIGYTKLRYITYPIIIIIIYTLGMHWLNAFLLGLILSDLYIHTKIYIIFSNLIQNSIITILLSILFLVFIGMENYYNILHLILAVLIIFFVISSSMLTKLFSTKPLVFLGKISFSLYLIHLPIICSITGAVYIFFEKVSNHNIAVLIATISTIIISLLLATVLYHIGDKFGIKQGKKISLKIQTYLSKESIS